MIAIGTMRRGCAVFRTITTSMTMRLPITTVAVIKTSQVAARTTTTTDDDRLVDLTDKSSLKLPTHLLNQNTKQGVLGFWGFEFCHNLSF